MRGMQGTRSGRRESEGARRRRAIWRWGWIGGAIGLGSLTPLACLESGELSANGGHPGEGEAGAEPELGARGGSAGESASSEGGNGGAPATTGGSMCEPGRQTACACGGGVEGYQICVENGSAWGRCVCPDQPTDTSTGVATITVTGTGTSVYTDTAFGTSTATNIYTGSGSVTGTSTGTGTGIDTRTATGVVTGTSSSTATGTGIATGIDTGENLVNVEGWVGGDPATASDNPAGVQGAWYLYGDQITCVVPEGNPCTADGCCLEWTTIVDSTYESWGCAIGLELNSTGGDAPVKNAYPGGASGFAIRIEGTSAPNPIRVGFHQAADTVGLASPFTELEGPGVYNVSFSDATCPSWAIDHGCTPAVASSSYDLFVEVPGGDAAGTGRLCITSLTAL